MKWILRQIFRGILLLFAAAIGLSLFYGHYVLDVAVGYQAKAACSATFVSGFDEDRMYAEDLSRFPFVNILVDRKNMQVIADFLGVERMAVYRPGLGCTLLDRTTPVTLHRQSDGYTPLPAPDLDDQPWPLGNMNAEAEISPDFRGELDAIMDMAFSETAADSPRNTRAFIVVHQGKIIAERYATGISRTTPLHGWSIAKSMTAAMVGAMIQLEKMTLHEPPLTGWDDNDPRSRITTAQFLHMTSGLEWTEFYYLPWSDATRMLFTLDDTAEVPFHQELAHEPGRKWQYSSGTTNLLQQAIRLGFDSDQIYWQFTRGFLHDMGMTSAVFEPDAAGTHIGSSFLYASARDWARFGLMLLNDGKVLDNQLLPSGFIRWCTTPGPDVTFHGAHFWLNTSGMLRNVPHDAIIAKGHDGQYLVVIPSRDLVLVRLGFTPTENWDLNGILEALLEVVE